MKRHKEKPKYFVIISIFKLIERENKLLERENMILLAKMAKKRAEIEASVLDGN